MCGKLVIIFSINLISDNLPQSNEINMNDDITKCKNCEYPLNEGSKYCTDCGQRAISLHKAFKSIVFDTLHETLDIDGRLMLTIKTLLFNPGRLSFDYNLGKRAKYTPPLRMYLVISILFFLIMAQVDLSTDIPALDKKSSEAQINAVYIFLPKLMFILLPIFALTLKVFYRSTFYISHLIFSLHFHCFSYVILVVMLPLEAIEKTHPIFVVMQIPLFSYLIYYLVKAMKLNYQESWLKTIGKMIFLLVIYSSIIMFSIETIQNYFAGSLF